MKRWACVLVAVAACGGDDAFIDAAPPNEAGDDDAAVTPADAGPATLTSTFDFPSGFGSLCSLGFDHVAQEIWLYPCSSADLQGFTTTGASAGTIVRPGEAADDVDISVAPGPIQIGTTTVAEGDLLFINGEAGTADVHLPDTAASTPLATAFGASHVVGGTYHEARGTLFLVQDNVASTEANTIAEVSAATGSVVNSFSTLPAINVNYGDLEVCQSSGNLFVVSSIASSIAELSPTGTLLAQHPLPINVSTLSGIGLGDGVAWVVGTNGQVWRLDGFPCGGS